jgi:hypothetical protein
MLSIKTQKNLRKFECGLRGLNDGLNLYEQKSYPQAQAILSGTINIIEACSPDYFSINTNTYRFVCNAIIDCAFWPKFTQTENIIKLVLPIKHSIIVGNLLHN